MTADTGHLLLLLYKRRDDFKNRAGVAGFQDKKSKHKQVEAIIGGMISHSSLISLNFDRNF